MTDHPAILAQRRAADPSGSAWVAANAGSGKTRVLTERVARLLLGGARPEKILCLTYTKAAAAEMQNRLFATLGGWAMADEAALVEALGDLTGGDAATGPDALARARRLFAEALETPGGLKIQTIHAFCDSVLRRFPLEAGAPPEFSVMETREQQALIAGVLDDMAAGADQAAFVGVAAFANEDGLGALAAAVARRREAFPEPVDETAISAVFNVPHPPDPAVARNAAFAGVDHRALTRMIVAWGDGAATDQRRAAALAEAADRDGDDLAVQLAASMLTKKGAPLKSPASKGAKAAEPEWEALCAHLTDVALAVREAGLAAAAADRALRLARFGGAFVRRYEAAKSAASALDFDDLVGRARDLLTRSDARAWALYRLDGGVDHILVDEAQDTSPAQWDVIDAIASEFRAGDGAGDRLRTSFVVGDEKQSIYSFQGAAPRKFDEMRGVFADGLAPVGGLNEAALRHSFRSAPAILRAVDATFRGGRAEGLTASGDDAAHAPFHAARAGRVELWPLIEAEASPPDPDPWAPVDMPSARAPAMRLADIVADHVAELVANARLPGDGRRVRPADILILLRARAPMMAPLIRNLKRLGVPVAGADRLSLREELAVRDLLALMRVAVTPGDDLSLAALLRSPLCDVSEDALFALAHGRKASLIEALRGAEDGFDRDRRLIARAQGDADFLRPYEFLERALTDDGGRRRLLARLGAEAEDAIDELLAQALAYEASETPSVEGFLSWIEAGETEIKREMESGRDEVRVMSVHGAKGLEAPVVILPDTMRRAEAGPRAPIVDIGAAGGTLAAWKVPADEAPAALREAREREARDAAAEHRRLLYVAMTRAEDWLIVAGAGDPDKSEGAWWGDVAAGLASLEADEADFPAGDGRRLIYQEAGEAKAGAAGSGDEAPPIGADPPSDPSHRSPDEDTSAPPPEPPPEPQRPRRVQASALVGKTPTAAPARGVSRELALLRGEAIHAALELGTGDRAATARVVGGFALPPDIARGAVEEALAARNLPDAAAFFAPGALVEAGVSVELGGMRLVGRIDRLTVGPDRIRFVDFKSDEVPPAVSGAAPEAYLAQMAAYRRALMGIYPGRAVEACLLWTAVPRLDPLDPARLDAALEAATAS